MSVIVLPLYESPCRAIVVSLVSTSVSVSVSKLDVLVKGFFYVMDEGHAGELSCMWTGSYGRTVLMKAFYNFRK